MTKEKMPLVGAFVFDLDGTLIDSKMDLVVSVNAMLRDIGRETLPADTVASYVGHGAPKLVASALGPGVGEAELQKALQIFLAHYEAHKLDATRAYDGVEQGLAAIAKYPMAVLTNKPAKMSVEILNGLGLTKYFRRIYGGDSFAKKKPDPAGAQSILQELGVKPGEAAMVGDSDVDIKTARNAGMVAVGVTYGFGRHDVVLEPADVYIDSFLQLKDLANGSAC
jgi:phosphoglycolate phosphatase